jgi:hypothetical protein
MGHAIPVLSTDGVRGPFEDFADDGGMELSLAADPAVLYQTLTVLLHDGAR